MGETVRQNIRFFLFATLAALLLRLLFFFRFSSLTADSFIYGDIAKNWLQNGVYGLSAPAGITPTSIRLPGYPAFLAAVFAIFGMEHYRAALALQILVDIGSCFLIADIARRIFSTRAAKTAFLLAALCPFLADYSAAALTETLEISFTALALDFALAGMESRNSRRCSTPWAICGLAIAMAILLRPDGGLLLMAIEICLLGLVIRERLRGDSQRNQAARPHLLRAAFVVGVISLAPLVPWTLRNLRTLHEFQPLAPRYANETLEFVPSGFNHWVKTWMADYVSVEEIYWAVPGEAIDAGKLPDRAFDSAAQRAETEQLLADYNQTLHVTRDQDTRFAGLAKQRIHYAPFRYYLWLPLTRIADMWLRPRTELLPSDTRWWEFNDDPQWSVLAVAMGVIGIFYFVAAFAGLMRQKFSSAVFLLVIFVVLRSAFLGTLENPEPRYALECYPAIISLAAAFLSGMRFRKNAE